MISQDDLADPRAETPEAAAPEPSALEVPSEAAPPEPPSPQMAAGGTGETEKREPEPSY